MNGDLGLNNILAILLKGLHSSVVEHFLGKEEVGSPILLEGSFLYFMFIKEASYEMKLEC
jgi:hypothetical protein